jgi:hypothetical protein
MEARMKPIDLAVTIERPIPQAQAQFADRVDRPLRSSGLAPRRTADSMQYRPRFTGLVIVWTVRRLQGEHVTFTFKEIGSITQVRATGRLRDRAHAKLTEALSGDWP